MKKIFIFFIFPFLILGNTNCGYTLKHRLKDVFKDSRGIFVPVFGNETDETGVETIFTDALIRELQSRHEVVIRSKRDAGLELRGTLTHINHAPTAFTDTGYRGLQGYKRLPSEFGVDVGIVLILRRVGSGSYIWRKSFTSFRRVDGTLGRTFDYQAPSSVGLLNQSIVESIYTDIARDIMRDVYDEMVESI